MTLYAASISASALRRLRRSTLDSTAKLGFAAISRLTSKPSPALKRGVLAHDRRHSTRQKDHVTPARIQSHGHHSLLRNIHKCKRRAAFGLESKNRLDAFAIQRILDGAINAVERIKRSMLLERKP